MIQMQPKTYKCSQFPKRNRTECQNRPVPGATSLDCSHEETFWIFWDFLRLAMLSLLLLFWQQAFVLFFLPESVRTWLVSRTETVHYSLSSWSWVSTLFRMSSLSSQMKDRYSWEKRTTECIEWAHISGPRCSLSCPLVFWPLPSSLPLFTLQLDITLPSGSSSLFSHWLISWSLTHQAATPWSLVSLSQTSSWRWPWLQYWSSHSCSLLASSLIRTIFHGSWSHSSTCQFSSMDSKLSFTTNTKIKHSIAKSRIRHLDRNARHWRS